MERRLAAILAADVVGYSRLMGNDEVGTFAVLKDHRAELLDPKAALYHGRTIKLMGDGALMEFPSVVEAVTFAVEIQCAMRARNVDVAEDEQIRFRIGINVGDVIVDGDDIYGDGVNVAARIEGLAEPGGICMSRPARDQVRDKIDVTLEDLGEIKVKNIARPVRVFKVAVDERAERLASSAAAPSAPLPGRRWPAATSLRRSAAGASLVLVTLLAAGLVWWQPWAPTAKPTLEEGASLALPDKPSIAVLPFENLGNDPTQEYFADGLTDDLITDLSKVSGLFVVARNSVFTFKGQTVSIKEVAEALGVEFVVEGSVRRAGMRVRVNSQLIEVRTGHHVWAERYDRQIGDLFAVQDDLVGRIVSALAVQLTRSEQSTLAQRPKPDFRAYDLYLQARDGYYSRDQARMQKSLELYAEAWSIDPSFARAYAGYARLAADIWRLSLLRTISGASARKLAEVAANKALALDPTLSEAHSVRALLKMVDGNHEAAVRAARRAVELDPNSADALTVLAIVLGYGGQPEAALTAIRAAVRLNPRPTPYIAIYHGWALFLNGEYDEAIAVIGPIAETRDRGLGDAPREILASAYAEARRFDEARAQVAMLHQEEPFLNLAYYRVVYDHHARAEDMEQRLDALARAGMPEWPLAFVEPANGRLTGVDLSELIFGTSWSGYDSARQSNFVAEYGQDGRVAYATTAALLNGTAFMRHDELCQRFEGFVLGRALCGPVFRHQSRTGDDAHDYVYVNPTTVRYFSVTQR